MYLHPQPAVPAHGQNASRAIKSVQVCILEDSISLAGMSFDPAYSLVAQERPSWL